MVKTILKQLREFKLPSILTPLCMIGEVICEMIIPILMAKIVDEGIGFNNPNGGDIGIIFKVGGMMLVISVKVVLGLRMVVAGLAILTVTAVLLNIVVGKMLAISERVWLLLCTIMNGGDILI